MSADDTAVAAVSFALFSLSRHFGMPVVEIWRRRFALFGDWALWRPNIQVSRKRW